MHHQGHVEEQELETGQEAQQLGQYGATYGKPLIKPPSTNWKRRRLNVVAVLVCLFVPWLLFCFLSWLFSFKLFYRQPAVCFLIAGALLAFVLWLGAKAFNAVKKSRDIDALYEPTWYIFLFLTSLFAWFLGIYYGYHNFHYRMQSYYGLKNLGNYADVDAAKIPGQQLMDGGRVVFKPGTHIDAAKAMSFRNEELYCVAPIVGANYSLDGAPQSYDFWAVGINCCCGDTVRAADFQCGEYMNPKANAGLRLMRDEQRPFYRLAVQQAVGAYGIRANHPLFFQWVEDPISASEAYRWEGHRQFLIGVYSHFAFQLLAVGATTMLFSRLEDK